jgi:hypothetical protein
MGRSLCSPCAFSCVCCFDAAELVDCLGTQESGSFVVQTVRLCFIRTPIGPANMIMIGTLTRMYSRISGTTRCCSGLSSLVWPPSRFVCTSRTSTPLCSVMRLSGGSGVFAVSSRSVRCSRGLILICLYYSRNDRRLHRRSRTLEDARPSSRMGR